mmetsp:Transcript_2558/g.2854  ORF Transcript_2558/g.2854 Transcript_2558/m.2854 type:complete len:101 (-) Transcript_2558:302-604(-)
MRWALVVAWIGWEFKTVELLTVDIVFMACGGKTERDVLGEVNEHIAWGVFGSFCWRFWEQGGRKIFCCRGFGLLDRGGQWRYFLWWRQEILNVDFLWSMM